MLLLLWKRILKRVFSACGQFLKATYSERNWPLLNGLAKNKYCVWRKKQHNHRRPLKSSSKNTHTTMMKQVLNITVVVNPIHPPPPNKIGGSVEPLFFHQNMYVNPQNFPRGLRRRTPLHTVFIISAAKFCALPVPLCKKTHSIKIYDFSETFCLESKYGFLRSFIHYNTSFENKVNEVLVLFDEFVNFRSKLFHFSFFFGGKLHTVDMCIFRILQLQSNVMCHKLQNETYIYGFVLTEVIPLPVPFIIEKRVTNTYHIIILKGATLFKIHIFTCYPIWNINKVDKNIHKIFTWRL